MAPRLFLAGQALLVFALGAWLASGRPIGIPGVWAWEVKDKPVNVEALVRAAAAGVAVIGLCWLGARRLRSRRRSDAPVVAGFVLLAFLMQITVVALAPASAFLLIAGTASPVSTEYFDVAWSLSDPLAFCRDYAVTIQGGHHHVATHPPGAVLFYWACIRLCQSPVFPGEAWERLTEFVAGAPRGLIAQAAASFPGVQLTPEAVGPAFFCCLALGALCALSVVPLYHLARTVAGRRTALVACGLFALTPAPVLLFQGLDALILLLSVTALAWLVASLRRGTRWPAAFAGLALGLSLVVSFGALAAMGSAALLVLLWGGLRREDRPRVWRTAVLAAATGAAVLLLGHVLCGMKLHVILRQAMAAHRQFTWVGLHRTYGTWVWLNLLEFACFVGLPLVVSLGGAVASAARRGCRGLTRLDLVGLAGLTVLLALDLSGSVRGEVGRVWLFMMPPPLIWAAGWLTKAAPGRGLVTLGTGLLTLAQLLILGQALTPAVQPF